MIGVLKKTNLGSVIEADGSVIPVYQEPTEIHLKDGDEVEFELELFWETGIEKPFFIANKIKLINNG